MTDPFVSDPGLDLRAPVDFRGLLGQALDPAEPAATIVGWSGRRLNSPLAAGDFILRERVGGGHALLGRVAAPGDGKRVALALPEGGEGEAQLVGFDGLMKDGLVVLRETGGGEALPPLPAPPPSQAQPLIKRHSTGPAVGRAQAKLNRVHASEAAQGRRGLAGCPLQIDGKFGPETQKAVIDFQKFAFAGQPAEWDGIIGPKTWTMLEAFAPDDPIIPPGPPFPPGPPIVPVINRPLDPTRWDPILRAAASPNVTVRSGNAVRPLIDGRETFLRMVDDIKATNGPTDYIYLLGWSYFDDFDMGGGNRMRDLLDAAATRDVQIRVMLWAYPGLVNLFSVRRVDRLRTGAAIRDDETANKTPISVLKLRALLIAQGIAPGLVPIIMATISVDDLARLGGSHHQKLLVVKRQDVLVGYCGGIDVNPDRLNVTGSSNGTDYHDDHCRVRGPAAWDLLQTFIRRWRHHPDSASKDAAKGPLRGLTEPIPAALTFPSPDDAPFGGTTSVAIARTFNPVHPKAGLTPERDIRQLLIAAIRNARQFIYIEDQYLWDLEMAAELARALPRIAHLTALIPGNGLLSTTPFNKEFRRDFVERVLRGASADDRSKVRIFQLSTTQTLPPTFGKHTYVHAKSWVFDDELAVIGSANCNRRGYQHDSEVDAFIFDDAPIPIVAAAREAGEGGIFTATFAQRYRASLWSEHLGVPASTLMDGVASASLWLARPAGARVLPFNHALPATTTQGAFDLAANVARDFIDPKI